MKDIMKQQNKNDINLYDLTDLKKENFITILWDNKDRGKWN